MVTKYTTGDAVMVPAVINGAAEVDGQIRYDVNLLNWSVPEDQVEVSSTAIAAKALRDLAEEIRRY